jgi:hypothetical protein
LGQNGKCKQKIAVRPSKADVCGFMSPTRNMTVAAAIDQFFDSDEAPWNYMMAVALVYCLPPIAIYCALRRFMPFNRVRV